MPEVTVAVPVKDRRERMLRCLDALLAQDHRSFEVLVLDNGSTDGTPDAVRERAAGSDVPVRVEVVPGSVGAVRNRAAELAQGELLAFTDSDCLPDAGWLTAAAAALRADPELGLVQGRTLPEEPAMEGWPATIEVTEYSGRFESCNVVFRRDAFLASNGFDEVVGHFWEDTAAGFALLRTGWKARYVPEAVVYHDVTYPGFRWHLERAQRMANAAHVIRRYPEIRRELLFARIFLRPRNAKFVAALAGLALARRHPLVALALSAPYVEMRLRPWPGARGIAQNVALDAAVLAGLLRGSIRHRSLVL